MDETYKMWMKDVHSSNISNTILTFGYQFPDFIHFKTKNLSPNIPSNLYITFTQIIVKKNPNKTLRVLFLFLFLLIFGEVMKLFSSINP